MFSPRSWGECKNDCLSVNTFPCDMAVLMILNLLYRRINRAALTFLNDNQAASCDRDWILCEFSLHGDTLLKNVLTTTTRCTLNQDILFTENNTILNSLHLAAPHPISSVILMTSQFAFLLVSMFATTCRLLRIQIIRVHCFIWVEYWDEKPISQNK